MVRWACSAALLLVAACSPPSEPDEARSEATEVTNAMLAQRDAMVGQIADRGVKDPRVLDALRRVERHRFVPADEQRRAYDNTPLPIGHAQTISQPYIVAAMTELVRPKPEHRVLEIGTGSGYQAAVLAEVVAEVFTIEIVPELAQSAREALDDAGYDNIRFRVGDGYQGWPEAAPFDAVLVTAAPPEVPEPLKQQLAVGGRLVIPVGGERQVLKVITRTEDGFTEEQVFPVVFVPMTGIAER